jgi:hypothetical protein
MYSVQLTFTREELQPGPGPLINYKHKNYTGKGPLFFFCA